MTSTEVVLRDWLRRKLDAERDLLMVAEKAVDVFEHYESCGDSDRFHELIGALGYALMEYAAKHKPATQADAAAEQGQIDSLLGDSTEVSL